MARMRWRWQNEFVATNRSARGQQTLFEDDYLVRSLGAIATSPDTALTELVANAWDAGAGRVDLVIPGGVRGQSRAY